MTARRLLLVTYLHPPIPFLGGDPWSELHEPVAPESSTDRDDRHDGRLRPDCRQRRRSMGNVVRTVGPDVRALAAPAPATACRRRSGRSGGRRQAADRAPHEGDRPRRPPGRLGRSGGPDDSPSRAHARNRLRDHDLAPRLDPPRRPRTRPRSPPPWLRRPSATVGTFEVLQAHLSRRRRGAGLDAWLDPQVVRRADRLTAATRPIIDDLQARFGTPGACVPNAWDPDLEPEVARAQPPELRPATG